MSGSRYALLDSIPAPDRDRLLHNSSWRALAKGQQLFQAHDREHRAYLLLSGVIKLGARDTSGNTTLFFLAYPGELIGDVGVLDGLPQPHEAIATTSCEVLVVDGEMLTDILEYSPLAALEVARCLARRVRWLTDTVFERSARDVSARLAGRLLDLADVLGVVQDSAVEMIMPLPQNDLGSLAGMCRESACKTMSRLRKEGVIDYDRHKLRILRPDVLERLRCGARA